MASLLLSKEAAHQTENTNRGQKYFNIALVLQNGWLTIFTRPANTCTCPLKAYAIKNIRELYVVWLPRLIVPKALVLQDKCFGKNYSSLLDLEWNFRPLTNLKVLTLKHQSLQKSSAFVVCWNILESYYSNSVGPDQTAPVGAVWSGSTLFASLLTLVTNVSLYMQQTT